MGSKIVGHTHTHAHTHIHTHTYTHSHTHKYTHTNTHKYKQALGALVSALFLFDVTYTFAPPILVCSTCRPRMLESVKYLCTSMCMCKYIRVCMCTCLCTYIHTYACIHCPQYVYIVRMHSNTYVYIVQIRIRTSCKHRPARM